MRHPGAAGSPGTGGRVSGARILAVDDQLYFRVFLEDLLREEGYEVTSAEGGAEALAKLESERFDVVVTDLVMPGMDGSELVQRVKERWPDQDIIVVTSVGDLRTAIDAMKVGASEYLLKPVDKRALLRSLEQILERRRLRAEHGRLMAENLELLGAFTQYERLLSFFSTLSLETLADRIVEVFCLETNAQGGVLWIARPDAPQVLRLQGVGGLVRVDEEPREVDAASPPAELTPILTELTETGAAIGPGASGSRHPCLYVRFQTEGPVLGVLRLGDKLDGSPFDGADRELAGRLASFAAQAIANALRFRALERRSFRDPATQAYTRAYFEDVATNEVRKASRFSRHTSLVRVEIDGLAALRERLGAAEYAQWTQAVAASIRSTLRSMDLLAVEADGRFGIHLPEADALGATVAKRRVRTAVESAAPMRALDPGDRPIVLAASATYPRDGTGLESLRTTLDARIVQDRASIVRALSLERMPFRGLVDSLLGDGFVGRAESVEQLVRFVIEDLARRPNERSMLFLAPGRNLQRAVEESLDALGTRPLSAGLVLVAERDELSPPMPVTWVSAERAGTECPFLVHFGEGAPYALLREGGASTGGVGIYHTADPVLVEHLAFQLGHELGVPISG
jgi:diguanylate cyclase (GGDEF)-like protein